MGESFDINYQGLGYGAPAIVDDKLLVWRDAHFIYAEQRNGQVTLFVLSQIVSGAARTRYDSKCGYIGAAPRDSLNFYSTSTTTHLT